MAAVVGHHFWGLKQYTKDIPPGWRPYSYPLREYTDLLSIWGKLTALEESRLGPAIVSRLEGNALKIAIAFVVHRRQADGTFVEFRGADAISLVRQDAEFDVNTGLEINPVQPSGVNLLLDKLADVYALDDQDKA